MIAAYFETRFRVGEVPPAWPDAFGVISAQATTGESWSDEDNAAADGRLQREMEECGRWFARVTGYSPNTGHAESGWAAEVSHGLHAWNQVSGFVESMRRLRDSGRFAA